MFNVTDFGALGDGQTDDTDAINAAIAAATEAKGVVSFPLDRTFVISKPLRFGETAGIVRGVVSRGER